LNLSDLPSVNHGLHCFLDCSVGKHLRWKLTTYIGALWREKNGRINQDNYLSLDAQTV